MNLILFAEPADTYRLATSDPRLEHVRGVLRLGEGDTFVVGVANGPRGEAKITRLDRAEAILDVCWERETRPPPPPLHLVLAIPRPATARKVLFDGTTLGVRAFHFFEAEKGDPAYRRSRLWTDRGWERQIWLGAEQAFETYLPPVHQRDRLGTALEQLPKDATRLALDPYEATTALATAPLDPALPTALAIGGERGWSARERALLRENGFTLCSLGKRVLRVETAVTAALALATAARGDWR